MALSQFPCIETIPNGLRGCLIEESADSRALVGQLVWHGKPKRLLDLQSSGESPILGNRKPAAFEQPFGERNPGNRVV
jgi:hypothetical protein